MNRKPIIANDISSAHLGGAQKVFVTWFHKVPAEDRPSNAEELRKYEKATLDVGNILFPGKIAEIM